METKVTIKFSSGKELELTQVEYEELKSAFKEVVYVDKITYPITPTYPVYPNPTGPIITYYKTDNTTGEKQQTTEVLYTVL